MSGMLRTRPISLFIIVTALTSACTRLPDIFELNPSLAVTGITNPTFYPSPWAYADLRAYDAPDAPYPAADVIAVYSRLADSLNSHPLEGLLPGSVRNNELQIRLDFIDLTVQSQCDIYLILDHKLGGSQWLPWGLQTQIEWDTLVKIPAAGEIEAWDDMANPVKNLALRVERDSTLDLSTISMSIQALPGIRRGARMQVFTTLPGKATIADQLAPFRSDSFPPAQASILFAFWNSLPAYTPAQALRRWDGAHTGPLGGRHGLYNLLRAARGYSIPLLLLDLKSPTSLAALDYLDGLPLVRKLASEGLLILPETIPNITTSGKTPEDFQSLVAEFSRTTSLGFGLSASQFIFPPLNSDLPGEYPFAIIRTPQMPIDNLSLQGLVHPSRWRDKRIIPIPEQISSGQATFEGFSLDARIELVQAALAANNPDMREKQAILVLGGDLPSSEWGVPQIARSAFRYLTAHPWMHVLDTNDLISLQPSQHFADLQTQSEPQSTTEQDEIINRLAHKIMELPPSPLQRNAWQALLSLFTPVFPSPEELSALRGVYIGQVNALIVAAMWAENPSPISSCEMDLDLDQRPECVLASDRVFIVSKLDSGAIIYAFALNDSGVHQIIDPTSQFTSGTSNPTGWDLTRGLRADPDVIPGAFSDDYGPYSYTLGEDRLTLQGNGIVKSYQLLSQGILVDYRSNQHGSTQIPLALDPWTRFAPGWGDRYLGNTISAGWTWELQHDLRVVIKTNESIHTMSFTETRKYLSLTEDPNLDYPPSHYLPFPLAVISIQSSGDFLVDIQWETVD